MDIEAPMGQTAEKRQKVADGGKNTSQTSEITAADTSKRKVPPSAPSAGESLSRKRGESKHELWKRAGRSTGLQGSMGSSAATESNGQREVEAYDMMSDQDDAGDVDKDKAGIRDLFRAIHNLPGKHAS